MGLVKALVVLAGSPELGDLVVLTDGNNSVKLLNMLGG